MLRVLHRLDKRNYYMGWIKASSRKETKLEIGKWQ